MSAPDPSPSSLLVRPLEPARFAQAFPLIAACYPSVTFESWQMLANGRDAFANQQRRAVFIAESPGNRIRGVCALAAGRATDDDLVIEQFALCRIGRRAIADALHRTIVVTATQWRCPGVRFALSADTDWLAAFLTDEGNGTRGHSLLRTALCPFGSGSPATRH